MRKLYLGICDDVVKTSTCDLMATLHSFYYGKNKRK